MKQGQSNLAGFGIILGIILLIVTPIAAWGTHIATCIQEEQWLFLIAGAIAFPVAIVHGIGIWFGVW